MDLQLSYDSLRDIFLDIEEENIPVKYSEMVYINGRPIISDIRPKPGISFGWRVSFAMGFSTISEYESVLHKVKCIESRIQKEIPDASILMNVTSSESDKMCDSSYDFNTYGNGDSMECLTKLTTLDIIFPTTSDFILSFMEDRKSKPKTKAIKASYDEYTDYDYLTGKEILDYRSAITEISRRERESKDHYYEDKLTYFKSKDIRT